MQERKYYHYSMQEAGAELYASAVFGESYAEVSGITVHGEKEMYYFNFCDSCDPAKTAEHSAFLEFVIDSEGGYSCGSYPTVKELLEENKDDLDLWGIVWKYFPGTVHDIIQNNPAVFEYYRSKMSMEYYKSKIKEA